MAQVRGSRATSFACFLTVVGAVIALVAAGAAPTQAASPGYTLVDIGTLGGDYGQALAVSGNGIVAGAAFTSSDAAFRAFVWTPAAGIQDIGTLGGAWATVSGVNDSGQVVGTSNLTGTALGQDPPYHAFSWTKGGGMQDLGTFGGATSFGQAVNDNGEVTGQSDLPGGRPHAFVWTQTAGMQDIGTLGGSYSQAFDINASGEVVGTSTTPGDVESHAFAWTTGGGMVDLGTLGGNFSHATAVSDTGQVVGLSTTSDGETHAFSWTPSTGMLDIGTLGGTMSEAADVNDLGSVVGEAKTAGDATDHAFAWTRSGGIQDLGTLGGSNSSALSISDSGVIDGESNVAGDTGFHAFAWTATSGMVDLGTLGGSNSQPDTAHSIDDAGEIAGESDTPGGLEGHAVLWQPATENGSSTQTVSGGSTVTTDPQNLGATADIPVQTSLTLPASAGTMTVSVTAQPSTGIAPSGFDFFGQQVVIDNGGVVAQASAPYIVSFTVDSSLLGGISPTDVQVFRDGVPAQPCTGPTAANPDPCVVSVSAAAGGDALVTVRTTHFSKWNLGKPKYAFSGFNQPVDNLPTVNTTKAGNAIPIKFSLGGNKGLNVFSSGFPTQSAINCQSGAPTDPIEQTVTAGGSSLSYDTTSNTYTYVWKTDKSWAGTCRELTMRLRDGTVKKADFSFFK